MKNLNLRWVLTLFIFVLFASNIFSQTTEITYQGQLQSSSMPANGSFDFEFVLYDGGGSQIGPVNQRSGVAVSNGIFSVNLDFQSSFTGSSRFLEIRVRQSGGGAFTTLTPRQPVTSAPYSIKSLTADTAASANTATTAANATNAANAVNAVTSTNFTGSLAGDVTGTQNATTVARIQSRNVASTPPLDGQVLKYSGVTNQWVPGTDNAGTGGGGGTITGVAAGTGLTGGGSTGNVTLGIANNGVQTAQIADGSVTDAKITTVSGAKITGTVANATNAVNATTATNATQLGGVAANQYLQNNGNGSALTDLNASSITTGTLANARLGQIPTANIADGAVTAPKIATGQVVKTLNGLTDNVTLAGSGNITVTPTGSTLTIASSGSSGVTGSGTPGTVPVFTGSTTLGSSPLSISPGGLVEIGAPTSPPTNAKLNVYSTGASAGIFGTSPSNSGVAGRGNIGIDGAGDLYGVRGALSGGTSGAGVLARANGGSGFALRVEGSAWFTGSSAVSGAQGIGVQIGSTSMYGAISASEYNVGVRPLLLNQSGGNVGIGFVNASSNPLATLHVGGSGLYSLPDNREVSIGTPNGESGFGIKGTSNRADVRFDGATLKLVAGPGTGPPPTLNGINITTTGLVGIGIAAPAQTLDVNGRARIRSVPTDGSTSYPVCVTAIGDLVQCSSSLRFKTNVMPFSGGMDVIKQLRPIIYDWKEDGRSDVGLGAEDVAAVAPDFASIDMNGNRAGVKYERLSILFINALKEQQVQIERQRKQIERQGRQIRSLMRVKNKGR